MTTDVRDLGLRCVICSEPAEWALARLSDRHVVGYCSPQCCLEDVTAALAPAVVVEGEAAEAPVSAQAGVGGRLEREGSLPYSGTLC
jgi:hypothetical protein